MHDDPDWTKLLRHECYWQSQYNWLIKQGYRLRARYNPHWVPSWHKDPKLVPIFQDDARPSMRSNLLDAIRLVDDSHVVIKLLKRSSNSEELRIMQYFSKEPQRSDPRNHCVPLLDTLYPPDDPGRVMIVLPVLRMTDNPDFDTVGEALDSIREIMEGLAFLHDHRTVHQDIRYNNYMMDPKDMFKERFSYRDPRRTFDLQKPIQLFQRSQRTGLWPRYYIIDFEHSRQYSPEQMPPYEDLRAQFATDNSAPELKSRGAGANPFPVDVYRFGHLIEMDYIKGVNPNRSELEFSGLKRYHFLKPLVEAMMREDPNDRVTMHEALMLFDEIVSKLPSSTLRSRVKQEPRHPWVRSFGPSDARLTAMYWQRRFMYIVKGVPPMRPKHPVERR